MLWIQELYLLLAISWVLRSAETLLTAVYHQRLSLPRVKDPLIVSTPAFGETDFPRRQRKRDCIIASVAPLRFWQDRLKNCFAQLFLSSSFEVLRAKVSRLAQGSAWDGNMCRL